MMFSLKNLGYNVFFYVAGKLPSFLDTNFINLLIFNVKFLISNKININLKNSTFLHFL